jgi:hypothetical protein
MNNQRQPLKTRESLGTSVSDILRTVCLENEQTAQSGGFFWRDIRLLTLLGHPVVLLNPFLGFFFVLKFAEVVGSFVWPRDFHAPIACLSDWV